MGVPYLLSHYALSVFPRCRAGLFDGEDETGRTLLLMDGGVDDD